MPTHNPANPRVRYGIVLALITVASIGLIVSAMTWAKVSENTANIDKLNQQVHQLYTLLGIDVDTDLRVTEDTPMLYQPKQQKEN